MGINKNKHHTQSSDDGIYNFLFVLFYFIGKWLDMLGDRLGEILVFLGVSYYFFRTGAPANWVILPILDSLFLLLYYYIVDISLAQGLSRPLQKITNLKFKNVYVKWGTLEPVIYGFIILAPLGLVKIQLVLVLLMVISSLAYQTIKEIKFSEKLQ